MDPVSFILCFVLKYSSYFGCKYRFLGGVHHPVALPKTGKGLDLHAFS